MPVNSTYDNKKFLQYVFITSTIRKQEPKGYKGTVPILELKKKKKKKGFPFSDT